MISNRLFSKVSMIFLGASIPLSTQALGNAAETCQAFRPLGSSGYEVSKSVSSTGVTPGVRNNWDTDFVVPTGTRFTRYIATITSQTPENYNVIINFRFGDNTAQQVFRRDGVRLVGGVPFQIIGEPPSSTRQPIQINTNIRGRQGATYRVGVSGCTKQ